MSNSKRHINILNVQLIMRLKER